MIDWCASVREMASLSIIFYSFVRLIELCGLTSFKLGWLGLDRVMSRIKVDL